MELKKLSRFLVGSPTVEKSGAVFFFPLSVVRGRHSRQGIPAGRAIIWGQQLGGVGELVSLSVIARAGEAGSRAGSQPGLRHPHHHWEQEHHHQPHQSVEADLLGGGIVIV